MGSLFQTAGLSLKTSLQQLRVTSFKCDIHNVWNTAWEVVPVSHVALYGRIIQGFPDSFRDTLYTDKGTTESKDNVCFNERVF